MLTIAAEAALDHAGQHRLGAWTAPMTFTLHIAWNSASVGLEEGRALGRAGIVDQNGDGPRAASAAVTWRLTSPRR